MAKRFPPGLLLRGRIFAAVRSVAREQSVPVFLVGGPLRDRLLGTKVTDIDIAVTGDVGKFGPALARRLSGVFVYHREFGTGTVRLKTVEHVDIARTRTETYPRPAALPRVAPADILADLCRRDFTVNALALDLTTGVLIDPFDGRSDLRRRLIRILHEQSFIDDPTRLFRAVRFSQRLGFRIEPGTARRMQETIAQGTLKSLTGQRVMNELKLIVEEDLGGAMIEELNRLGVFQALFRTRLAKGFLARYRGLAGLPASARLDLLLAELGSLGSLPLTREQTATRNGLRCYPRVRRALLRADRPSRIDAVLRRLDKGALVISAALESRPVARRIMLYLGGFSAAKPALTGLDLKRIGITPGPVYARILSRVRAARLDGRVKDKAGEIALARRLARIRTQDRDD